MSRPALLPRTDQAAVRTDRDLVRPFDLTWDDNDNSLAVGGNTRQRYFIEQMSLNNKLQGSSQVIGGRTSSGCNQVNTYLITGRGTSARGAAKFVQSYYSVLNCPPERRKPMIKSMFKPLWIGPWPFRSGDLCCRRFKVAVALTAFNPAQQPIGYVAQDEITSFNLKSGNEILFRGQYEREFWSGTVLAYKADASGNLTGGTVWWTGDTGELMNAQNFDTGRLIATMKDDGTARSRFALTACRARSRAT